MQPTLRLRTVVPSTLATLARFRAMGTCDAEVPFRLKRVKRQKMIFDVGLTLFPADVQQGIEFQYAAALLENIQRGAVVTLPTHQAAYPNLMLGLKLFKGFHLVDGATVIGVFGPSLI